MAELNSLVVKGNAFINGTFKGEPLYTQNTATIGAACASGTVRWYRVGRLIIVNFYVTLAAVNTTGSVCTGLPTPLYENYVTLASQSTGTSVTTNNCIQLAILTTGACNMWTSNKNTVGPYYGETCYVASSM